MNTTAKMRRLVDFHDPRQFMMARLLVRGFSSTGIARATGLSVGQINYRVRKGGYTGIRKKMRDGETKISHLLMAERINSRKIEREIVADLRRKKLLE